MYTRCNYCNVEALKKHAATVGAEVVFEPGTNQRLLAALGTCGVDAYLVYGAEKVWSGWFAGIPETCACSYHLH